MYQKKLSISHQNSEEYLQFVVTAFSSNCSIIITKIGDKLRQNHRKIKLMRIPRIAGIFSYELANKKAKEIINFPYLVILHNKQNEY